MKSQKTWVRVAGNATKIKAGDLYGWRCYFKGNQDEISLKNWFIGGVANSKNVIPGFSATKNENGLVAWIDFFGLATIKDDILYINLSEPPD